MSEAEKNYFHQKIANWLERMEKELFNTTTYMIPETSKIMKEMKEEIAK